MKKKILAWMLVLAFLTVLAACGKNDAADSSRTSGEISAGASSAGAASSEADSIDASSGAISEVNGEVYEGDGYRFTIPAGFVLTGDSDGSLLFMNENLNILGVEVLPNTDGKTTLTQEDVKAQLLNDADEVSASSEATVDIQRFENIKVDGREAVKFNCVVEMDGSQLSIYSVEIVNGDKFLQFALIASEADSGILDALIESVKID